MHIMVHAVRSEIIPKYSLQHIHYKHKYHAIEQYRSNARIFFMFLIFESGVMHI